MARFGLRLAGFVTILWTLSASGQNAAESTLANEPLRIVATEGRELVVLPPYELAPGVEQPIAAELGGLAVQSYETASHRTLVVSFQGETYSAATPLDGPRSRLVFDPARRAFAELSPSLRIELHEGLNLDAVAEATGATGVTVFESPGFAVLTLPRGLHPAEAVALVRNLPGQPEAALRLRAPGIQWR